MDIFHPRLDLTAESICASPFAKIDLAVGKPAVFRLRYGCIPSRVQEKSEAELQNRASLQPVHEEEGSRMTSLQDGPVKSCDALLQKKKATGRRSCTNSLNVRTSQSTKQKRKGKAPGFGQAVLTETVRVEVGSIMPCSNELNSHLLSAVTNAKTVPKPHNRATTKGKSSYRDIMPVAMTEAAATRCDLQQISLLTRTTAIPQPSQEQTCMPSPGLPFMGSPVELERPAELCQAGEAMRVDVTTPKLKLQLFPIDDFTRAALTKDGHNPHLELTFKSKKSVSSIL